MPDPTMPALEVGRLVAPDGLHVGFVAWDYTTITRTTPSRPWEKPEVIPTVHYRLEMLGGEFAGEWDEFYEDLEGDPEVFAGVFAYKGVQFRYEALEGPDAAAAITGRFDDWP